MLTDISWEVKRGERVGLVGKSQHPQIVMHSFDLHLSLVVHVHWLVIGRAHVAGVNGAGKTTQLQIITGSIEPDSGELLKEKANMKIAYLTQEFDVVPSRTVRVSEILCKD